MIQVINGNVYYNLNYYFIIFIFIYRYVILENLRLMLTSFDPNDPFYISCKLSGRVKLGHMSGVTGNFEQILI